MSEVLSQSEIDYLIGAMMSGQETLQEQIPEEPQVVAKKYDFRKPNKFTKDQLRTLYMINENLARILANFLSGYLRSSVDIKIATVEQITYEEFLLSISGSVLMTVFQMPPLNGSAVMEYGSTFIEPIIDLLFGGTGKKEVSDKELTEIEMKVLKTLNQKILDNMAVAWSDVFSFEPQIDGLETNIQFSQIISPNETIAIITFTADIADNQSILYLCFPWETLKEAIPNLTAQNWFASQKYYDESSAKDIINNLNKVNLSLSASCGETDITIREFLQLEEGDVILLNKLVGEDMELFVDSIPKFNVQPGVISNKMAAVITGKI